jgi:hypothetical protein
MNPDATPTSQGFKSDGTTRGGGPQDLVADAAHGGGDRLLSLTPQQVR